MIEVLTSEVLTSKVFTSKVFTSEVFTTEVFMGASLRTARAALCLIGSLAIAACDSADNDVDPGDVAGEYVFTDLRFVPDAAVLPAVIILDTLIASNTRLQLFSSGRFTLLYQFEGANPEFIGGNFDVDRDRVRVIGREDEAQFYRQLLLGPEFSLQRNASDGFSAIVPRTVNLEEFSNRYRGLRSVDGDVVLELVRR